MLLTKAPGRYLNKQVLELAISFLCPSSSSHRIRLRRRVALVKLSVPPWFVLASERGYQASSAGNSLPHPSLSPPGHNVRGRAIVTGPELSPQSLATGLHTMASVERDSRSRGDGANDEPHGSMPVPLSSDGCRISSNHIQTPPVFLPSQIGDCVEGRNGTALYLDETDVCPTRGGACVPRSRAARR
ncbi:hypothetical protein GGS23DRAFT_129224 [Durotheca rogersii]|uniref:uncharacterized protein n=1 Tax=Durotheca rogersii TaxID=419775 RepID=UPI00221FA325|nr:uncharacterized protein GGS23DRAFT_129224 [Durotheca rogersii]KAI5861734.1 hypothetical protein GGS23DRAFT_129224 [Durotheca rogersii]